MEAAYKAASKLARKMIEREDPEALKRLEDTQVVVVSGCYDHGQSIFELCEIPHTLISPAQVAAAGLVPDQILYVNCPGKIPERGLETIRSFVSQGGMLVTTDWALKHVIEPVFPGFIAYNDRATADDVVRVVFEPVEDTFLEGLLDPNDDPLWWLEGSSYPIRVLDERVKVLVSSEEMRQKYGEGAIVVAFEFGEGKVYHLTSHFYLQRTETRTKRHQQGGMTYARAKGFASGCFDAETEEALAGSNLTQVQSAYTSSRSVTNIVVEQSRRVAKRKST